MLRGNKGEWSELYSFFKLLEDKQLNAADENLERLPNIFYPILSITREETGSITIYEILKNDEIRIVNPDRSEEIVVITDLKKSVASVLEAIKNGDHTIPIAEGPAERLKVKKLNAGNQQKEDLLLNVHDARTGTAHSLGFSIKSFIGASPTLLNASGATNFIYKISGLDEDLIEKINAIKTKSKVRDRIAAVANAGGTLTFSGLSSPTFEKNLRRIETGLPEVVAKLLKDFYSGKGSSLRELISQLGANETLFGFPMEPEDFEQKIKLLLHNVALGMVPATVWNGRLRAQGGTIVVKKDGELLSYAAAHLDAFREYLFKNTHFETASTGKHKFGKIYKQDGELFIRLNLQIRFNS